MLLITKDNQHILQAFIVATGLCSGRAILGNKNMAPVNSTFMVPKCCKCVIKS